MPEPLKNLYNESFFRDFIKALQPIYPKFDEKSFLKNIFDADWPARELKDRMYHISMTLRNYLPSDFKKAVDIITKLSAQQKMQTDGMSFEYMFLPDFVERYGLDDFETSTRAMEEITQYTSCEFAVRPFIVKYPKAMMRQMLKWSTHKDHRVRRFASEGCRPRLPWAMALPDFKKDPGPILPILENLKNDPSEFVRRSVANNLNDISKDNPDILIRIAKDWYGKTTATDKLVKHACRTLLKQGHPKMMTLFGYGNTDQIKVEHFKVHTPKVKIGDNLWFNFQMKNQNDKATLIRLEYAIYFQKANGTLSKKVFKISEKEYAPGSSTNIERKQSFRVITTRKLHPGLHQVALIINGLELEKHDFLLI